MGAEKMQLSSDTGGLKRNSVTLSPDPTFPLAACCKFKQGYVCVICVAFRTPLQGHWGLRLSALAQKPLATLPTTFWKPEI